MKNFTKFIGNVLKQVVPIILVIWFLTSFIIANAVVPSGSMEKTIMTGSRTIGWRLSYEIRNICDNFNIDTTLGEPKRGDIIIFRYPDNENIYFVKRLIGCPGDKVEIIPSGDGTGFLKINGVIINESYLPEDMIVLDYQRYDVPENKFFFLGDNRNHSQDARYWNNTYVNRDKLVAKVLFQYFPKIKSF